jgi:hypothetical protein
MTIIPTAITPPSTVGLEPYLDMLFSSILCALSLEGSSISVPVWEKLQEENLWENTFLDSLSCQPFSQPSTIGLGYNLDMLFCKMLSRFWMVKIRTNHSKQKLCFLHSKSISFRSVRLNLCFWKVSPLDGVDIWICDTYNNDL